MDPKTNILSGAEVPPLYNKYASMGQVLLSNLIRTPEKVSQICIDDDKEFTCGELHLLGVRVAQNFQDYGIEMGDITCIITNNATNSLPIVIGCTVIGSPLLILSPSYEDIEIAHFLKLAAPKLIFCDDFVVEKLQEIKKNFQVDGTLVTLMEKIEGFDFVGRFFEETGEEENFVIPSLGDGSKIPCLLLGTSGSTGLPKMTTISHAQSAFYLSDIWTFSANDVGFAFSNLFWISGIAMFFNAIVNGGTNIITSKPFDPELAVETIQKYKVTQFFGHAPALNKMVRYLSEHNASDKLSSLKYLFAGGCYVTKNLKKSIQSFFKNVVFVITYGISECGSVATMNYDGFNESNSVGKVRSCIQMKIVDDEGFALRPNQNGEIMFKCQYTFLGYFGQPEKTKEVLGKDGWFHTGDCGYVDENGDLFILGRMADYKISNCLINCYEIEDQVERVAGVSECCIVEIHDCNGKLIPAAVVVIETPSVAEKDILEALEPILTGSQKLLGGVYITDFLPTTVNGKYKKIKVKDIALKGYQKRSTMCN